MKIFIFITILLFILSGQVSNTLEEERLAALPRLKSQLSKENLRERADVIFVFDEKLFNKVLGELTEMKFAAGGLFNVTVKNPRVVLKNGLALARLEAVLEPTNALLSISNTLQVTARLLVEEGEGDTLVAKLQVIELLPSGENAEASPLSPEQLSGLLPPLQLPLELDFDQTITPGSMKQTKPIGYEISSEPRRISGRFQVTELLPLDGRLAVLARIRNLTVK